MQSVCVYTQSTDILWPIVCLPHLITVFLAQIENDIWHTIDLARLAHHIS